MPTFAREINGFRYAETRFGDDMRRVALRELNDAARWTDLVALNRLSAPYLTDDPTQVRPGVLLTGTQLLIPAPQATAGATVDPAAVFGIDLALDANGDFAFASNGDMATISGWDNFLQSVRIRLQTHQRDLMFHAGYGNLTYTLLGRKAGPTENALAAFYARSALLSDSRVASVTSCKADVSGDRISIVASIVGVGGKLYNVQVVI